MRPFTSDDHRFNKWIALFATIAIVIHLALRQTNYGPASVSGISIQNWPIALASVIGGIPLVIGLLTKCLRCELGADLLAGLSIITSLVLGEYLAGTLVVLMLSGGEALEALAVNRASSVLGALVKRNPTTAHRKVGDEINEVMIADIRVGDTLFLFPHEICPVDGTVVGGHGTMDESFLTGEPYLMPKAVGSNVLSGALNGETSLTIRADKLAVDSRYAQVMRVIEEAEQHRPPMRRIGDALGAIYTPVAVAVGLGAWWWSGNVRRLLAVLVVATPCPVLIAIPVAIIGAVSLCARRNIIVRDPAVLERIKTCRTAIFDKTGTLTYGRPTLTDILPTPGISIDEGLSLVASLERYSKHPLAGSIISFARNRQIPLREASDICEMPGEGLKGTVGGRQIRITNRRKLLDDAQLSDDLRLVSNLPHYAGMESIAVIDNLSLILFHFRDQPRSDGAPFVQHLLSRHHFSKLMIVSGDKESEVRYLAELVGIRDVYFNQTPEQKLELVRRETSLQNTVFVGDGINDAPALAAATVGIAFGANTDVTSEAAHAVILDSSLSKVDEILHIGQRLRQVVLQSAVGGLGLSLCGIALAACGVLAPVTGAILQEAIDLLAVLNALRAARSPSQLTDYDSSA